MASSSASDGAGAARGALALYAALLVGTGWMLAGFAPGDEAALPEVGARPRLELVEVEELELAAAAGLPAVRARRATPLGSAAPIAIAGVARGLRLEGVTVALDAGLRLEADDGELVADHLALRRVRVPGAAGDLLVAGAAELAGGSVHFPGLVVWRPGTDDERVERDVRVDWVALTARLRGR